MFEIRKAEEKDIPTLAKLERDCFQYYLLSEAHFKKNLKSQASEIYVGVLNNEITGFVMMMTRSNSKRARIYSLAVDSKFRKQKLGSILMNYCEEKAKDKGYRSIILEVMMTNSAGIQFYRKHGFTEHELRENYYETGVHAIRMVKEF